MTKDFVLATREEVRELYQEEGMLQELAAMESFYLEMSPEGFLTLKVAVENTIDGVQEFEFVFDGNDFRKSVNAQDGVFVDKVGTLLSGLLQAVTVFK